MTEKFYRATGIFSVHNPFSLGSVKIGQLSNRNGGKVSSKRVGRKHFIQKKDGRKGFIKKRWDTKKSRHHQGNVTQSSWFCITPAATVLAPGAETGAEDEESRTALQGKEW